MFLFLDGMIECIHRMDEYLQQNGSNPVYVF
jgi:hypothetical protein